MTTLETQSMHQSLSDRIRTLESSTNITPRYPSVILTLISKLGVHPFSQKVLELINNVVFDDGLNRDIQVRLQGSVYNKEGNEIENPSYDKTFNHRPVSVFNRQTYLKETFHEVPDFEAAKDKNLAFIKLDVKDFRAIDRVGCDQVSHSECLRRQRSHQTMADYTNNEIYTRADDIIQRINQIFTIEGKSTRVILGRIGGDEIGIVVKGASGIEEILEIYKAIVDEQRGIQSIESYFNREGKTTKEKIRINADSKIIYFSQNNISTDKIGKIRALGLGFAAGDVHAFEMLQKYGRLPEDDSHSNVSVNLPKRLNETEHRLRNHYRNSVDRAKGFYSDLAYLFSGDQEFDDLLGEFFEKFVKDQMTGSPATNFRVYMERALELMKNTHNNSVHNFTYDLQGPKEINGLLSYDATDMAVNSLVVKIFDQFSVNGVDLHQYLNICVGRLGTKVYVTIALKPGMDSKFLNMAMNKLNAIYATELVETIDGVEKSSSIPVARTQRSGNIPPEEFRLEARRNIEEAKGDFYKRMLLKLVTPSGDMREKMDAFVKLANGEFPETGINNLNALMSIKNFLPILIHKYRPAERRRDLICAIDELLSKLERGSLAYSNLENLKTALETRANNGSITQVSSLRLAA